MQKDSVGMYPPCKILGTSVLGRKTIWSTTTSRKLWSNCAQITIDREDRRIHHMAGEHLSASIAEHIVFFGTRVTQGPVTNQLF
ncbi:hypothetical protein TNCV_2741721 [Trichonephila clavipes]|nr:hypothetical protein TNCV_2741721 [Trichonephila clavipes]